jgi:hypothetical protein
MMNFIQPASAFVTAQSMTATFHTAPQKIMLSDNVGLFILWTGTPTGTFTIECSIDYQENTFNPGDVTNTGNWTALTLPGTNTNIIPTGDQPAGGSGSILANLNQLPFPWIRVTYTAGSSTGSCTCWLSAKGV